MSAKVRCWRASSYYTAPATCPVSLKGRGNMEVRAWRRMLDRCLNTLTEVGLATIVLTVSAQVIFRYILGRPLMWSEELTKMVYLWLTFIGSTVAARDGIHIRVDYFLQKASRGTASTLKRFSMIISIIFCSLTAYQGCLYARIQVDIRSVALNIPLAWVTGGIVVGMSLMCIYYAILLTDDVIHGRRSDR